MDFNRDWEQRAKEINTEYKKIPDGEYLAKILSASYTVNKDKYKVVEIKVEILNNKELEGATSTKTYYIDDAYPHKKKYSFDWKMLDKLFYDFKLLYKSEREFINCLYDLQNKNVKFTIKTGKPGPDGTNYKVRYIDAIVKEVKQVKEVKKQVQQETVNNQKWATNDTKEDEDEWDVSSFI